MKKISRSKSLKYYILLPLILIILFQATIFASIIVFSNTSENLDQKLFRVLDNTVAAREASLEQQFSAFVNMDAFYQSVTMLTVEKAGALGLSIGDYTADAANRQSLLGSLTPVVLRALRRGGATSCFVILDGEAGSTQKDGLYLRDFNPSDSPESNSDVLIEAGPSQLLYDYIDAKKRAFCRKWNIPIALDDFGSGYSNSDMLVTRLFHYVKLDMGLIKNIDQTPSTQALVRSTIDYCHQNQLLVIAEGIETESEYNTVKNLGADFMQGFYLAKPAFTLYKS